MPDNRDSDYQVGYGKPPQHTRFKKGESGNPTGRPKGSKNLTTLLEKELKQRVMITENGRRRRITKQEAMVKHLVNKAVSGDRPLMHSCYSKRFVYSRHAQRQVHRAQISTRPIAK